MRKEKRINLNQTIMENQLKDITAVVNHKGGVAKTSTVLSLAGGLLRRSRKTKVLVIDMDSQCNLSLLCGWDITNTDLPTVYDALKDETKIPVYKSERGIYYTPASRKLKQVDLELYRKMQPNTVLWECFGKGIDDRTGEGLEEVTDFDYILLDCPPDLSTATYNAMAVASRILIPMQLEPLSINGLGPILIEQEKVDRLLRNRQGQDVRILPVMTDQRTNIARGYMEYLRDPETFGDYLCKTYIRKDVKMGESQSRLMDIFTYAPYSRVAIDYQNLIKELY